MSKIYLSTEYEKTPIDRTNPTTLLQAESLGYIKRGNYNIPVIDIHRTNQGIQIEVDYGGKWRLEPKTV